jgi:ribosomal subunit interface protein
MKIDIKAVHFTLDQKTRDYAAEKIGHLEKYYKNIISAGVSLDCDHEDSNSPTYLMSVLLKVPGKDLFAKVSCRDLHEGIDALESKLKDQLFKMKDRSDGGKIHAARRWVKGFFGREES